LQQASRFIRNFLFVMKATLVILLFIQLSGISQSYTLNVTNAYGAGTYNKGDIVHVWSNPADANYIFSHWSGDGATYLTSIEEWHAQLIVPAEIAAEEYSLTANYVFNCGVNLKKMVFFFRLIKL